MALNMIYKYSERLVRERALSTVTTPTTAPTSVQTGVPVVLPDGPAVSLTASGGATVTITGAGTLPQPLTSVTYGNGGVGNLAGNASFAFDGTFEFAVAGATTSTVSGVQVYITTAGALTLTEGTNVAYGRTDYPRDYAKVAGRAPVQIGA